MVATTVVAAVSAVVVTACTHPSEVTLPPTGDGWDYQIGGAYRLPEGVGVVARDGTDPPAADAYNICYLNAFQTQPDETDRWTDERPDLLLRDDVDDPIADPAWPDELLLDISTGANREALAELIAPRIEACAEHGFDAVELDNLDSFTRSAGRLGADDAVAHVRLLVAQAHRLGLAVAQKNTSELLPRQAEAGFDFAVVEECGRPQSCGAYVEVYGDRVFVVEYDRAGFEQACSRWPALAVVLRDRDVLPADEAGHVHDAC